MPRYKLLVEYDGSPFAGWQKQLDHISVQSALEAAIKEFCGVPAEVVGAGRTDAGVHAIAQVAHVDLPKEYDPFKVMQGVNYHLRMSSKPWAGRYSVSILHAERVEEDFHARFSALKRHYLYRIINRHSALALDYSRCWQVPVTLNVAAMREGASHLVGHYDFTSFRDAQCQAKSPVKTMERVEIEQLGQEIRVHVSARSFLHHQVRIMVGTLMQIGTGRLNPDTIPAMLAAKNRNAAGLTAPPEGLYLVGVDY